MENLHFYTGMKDVYKTDFADKLYNLMFKNVASLSTMSRQIVYFQVLFQSVYLLFKLNIFYVFASVSYLVQPVR